MVRSRTLFRAGLGGLVALTTAFALAPPASAHPVPLHVAKTITRNYVAPLQFSVRGNQILVADSFTASLYQVTPKPPAGTKVPLAHRTGVGADIAGIATQPDGQYAFTSSDANHKATNLEIVHTDGHIITADLSKFEKKYNPDKVNHYGVHGTVTTCQAAALKKVGAPVSYTGLVDSHPYSVVQMDNDEWAVADAGGNDILKVDAWGHVSVLSVLPPVPVKFTPALVKAAGLPACLAGLTYAFEPVPTDVELNPWGVLYASSLPGGAGTGYGAVYKIPWDTGIAVKVVGGLPSATNIAFNDAGDIFIADLTAGTLWEANPGGGPAVAVFKTKGLVGVEIDQGRIYVSTAPAALEDAGPSTSVTHGAITAAAPPPPAAEFGAVLLLSP